MAHNLAHTALSTIKCLVEANLCPTPFKNLPNQTPPGWHPPNLADGPHSSFLHTILRVRLASFYSQRLPSPSFFGWGFHVGYLFKRSRDAP